MASVDPPLAGLFTLHARRLAFEPNSYAAMKDPCPVLLDGRWHLFGTGAHEGYRYDILHATADGPTGPWRLLEPAAVPELDGTCVAAPAVVADGDDLHMFLQTEYNLFDGRIEHLVSTDGGRTFDHRRTALRSLPGSAEAGIYDPHPALVGGEHYIVYSGFDTVGRPDIFLARSTGGGWDGPWERLGRILGHEDVPWHNQHDHPVYEWGLEGAQLVELPDGRVLLNAVCFLAGAEPGHRQRIFFAVADRPTGPYTVVGSAMHPAGGRGEIGHAAALVVDEELVLFFQERAADGPWRYGLATATLGTRAAAARSDLEGNRSHDAARS